MPIDISVIIPCYNHGRFLRQTVNSVLDQAAGMNLEVIVIDDGSIDQTPEIATDLGDKIRYIAKKNAGLSAARNTGILEARGELIQILDADDLLKPGLLRMMLKAAMESAACSVFHSSWDEVDERGVQFASHEAMDFSDDVFHFLLAHNVGPPCRYTVRRTAFANSGLFDVSLKSCEDWDMWLRLAASGCKFKAVPAARVAYRRTPHSMSKNYHRMWTNGLAVLHKNRRTHENCRACEDSFKRGKSHLRSCCFMGILKHDLVSKWKGRRLCEGVLHAGQAVIADPAIALHLARETWRHLSRRGELT